LVTTQVAINAIGMLPDFSGRAIHDFRVDY
jgi:hypothetical protein